MNIYFACSITGGREFEPIFQSLVNHMLQNGHTVPTEHLATSAVRELEMIVAAHEVYTRDIDWIKEADALVAEVSTPSHGVGYEIGYALGLGKPVLCLHHASRSISKMISGNPNPLLQVAAYQDENHANQLLERFLQTIGQK